MDFIGEYRILNELGRGEVGKVYLVEDRNGAKLAVKVLHPVSVDNRSIELFEREWKLHRYIDSDYIAKVEEYKVLDYHNLHYHCLIMEYVPGQDLRKYLNSRQSISPKVVIYVAWQVCQALIAAHDRGVFHRDIKPENVIISEDFHVKVTDFGLASKLGSTIITLSNIAGTASYISPEQAEGKKGDARSDLYSLGIMLYEMLAGHPPFTGDNPASIMHMHVTKRPVHLRKLRPDIPYRLAAIIHKCLEKSPKHRYQSAQDMVNAIEENAKQEGIDPQNFSSILTHTQIKRIFLDWSPQRWYEIVTNLGASAIGWFLVPLLALFLLLFGVNPSIIGLTPPLFQPAQQAPLATNISIIPTTPINRPMDSTPNPATATQTATQQTSISTGTSPATMTLETSDAIVVAATLNMRLGPGTDFQVVDTFSGGTRLTIIGRNSENSWFQVRAPNTAEGWMAASGLQINRDVNSIQSIAIPTRPTARPTSKPAPRSTATPQPTITPELGVGLSNLRIINDTPKSLAITIDYKYDGREGDTANISATLGPPLPRDINGVGLCSSNFFLISPGQGTAELTITCPFEAGLEYTSETIYLDMFGQNSKFITNAQVGYHKTWFK